MSEAAVQLTPRRLQLAEAARIQREALKDKSYRFTPVGQEVGRYYRWKKNEWGAQPTTLRDYESVLAKTATFFADLELSDLNPPVGTERLRECWEFHWSEATSRTKSKVRSIWNDFFDWAVRERGMTGNPSRALAAPKPRDPERRLFSRTFVERVIAEQTYAADRIGVRLILQYGIRRGELAAIRFKHFDFERKRLTIVAGKGGKQRQIPIVDAHLWNDLGALQIEIAAGPDTSLLYHLNTRKRVVPLEEAEEVIEIGRGEKRGYAWTTLRRHDVRAISGKVVHLWWYRRLEQAGLVPKGTTGGENMHRGRHTAITEFIRKTNNVKLAQMLAGHSDLKTTLNIYTLFDDSDLETAMRGMFPADDPDLQG